MDVQKRDDASETVGIGKYNRFPAFSVKPAYFTSPTPTIWYKESFEPSSPMLICHRVFSGKKRSLSVLLMMTTLAASLLSVSKLAPPQHGYQRAEVV